MDLQVAETTACCERQSVMDRLEQQKTQLQTELTRTQLAIDALNANPEITKVLTLLSKALGNRPY